MLVTILRIHRKHPNDCMKNKGTRYHRAFHTFGTDSLSRSVCYAEFNFLPQNNSSIVSVAKICRQFSLPTIYKALRQREPPYL